MPPDYLAAGPLIVERIQAVVPGLGLVAQRQEIGSNIEAALLGKNTGVLVVYDGEQPLDSTDEGTAQVVQQRWLVVLCVRNASGQADGAGVRATAGPLLSELISALSGHKLAAGYARLRRAPAMRPAFSPAFGYYPLLFTLAILNTTY